MNLKIPKIDLTSGKAVIFTAYTPNIKHHLTEFWQSLSAQEKDQAERFVNDDLKDRYVLSHGLLRYILSSYVDTSPQNICYLVNQFGKPFLANNHSRLQFNMSHSRDYVAYGVSLDHQIGIDIERKSKDINLDEIVDLVLTAAEMALYQKLDTEGKFQTFYRIWTKKEAIIKAIGQGLSYPIKEIEVMDSTSKDKSLYTTDNNAYHYQTLEHLLEGYAGAVAFTHSFNGFWQVDLATQEILIN